MFIYAIYEIAGKYVTYRH